MSFFLLSQKKTHSLKHPIRTAISTTANLFDGAYKDTNGFTEFNLGEHTQRAAVKSFGSWAGATLGAQGGAYIGSFCFPPVGTIVGGFVGGVAGGIGGEYLFENAYNLIP